MSKSDRFFPLFWTLTALVFAGGPAPRASAGESPGTRPNVILILADDLGYGDLGCFGQKKILTPRLDQMAGEGIRFTQFYAGSCVCAPSRSVLMTGQHAGHTFVRGNAGRENLEVQTLRAEDRTVAQVFSGAGYRTALIGKWGLGELGSTGHPLKKGFDYFYGYLNQGHAHNYFPEFLWRNEERVPLNNRCEAMGDDIYGRGGAGVAIARVEYSHDLIVEEGLRWVEKNRDAPFFLYWALTIPHANNEATRKTGDGQEVPDYGIYERRDWTRPNKGQAAMITRMDRDVGRMLDLLRESGLERRTLVLFTSDNGHHREGGNDPEFFDANGPLRGMKRDLYEGGIRVPTIAWWPGTVRAGTTSAHVGYFGDVMATACDLTGTPPPSGIDSISLLPTLRGAGGDGRRGTCLYWEFYEGKGGAQAVRFDDWKAVRKPAFDGRIELFDLSRDLGETTDVAAAHPDLVERAAALMREAHVPSPNWVVRSGKAGQGKDNR